MENYYFEIPANARSPKKKFPILHNGSWINHLNVITCNPKGNWLYLWGDQKCNTDIQKWFGYSLDLFRLSIVRLGMNNGWAPTGSRYNGYEISFYAYLTKNGKRYTDQRYGKFFIGKANKNYPIQVYHQLTSKGYPFFAIFQNGKCLGAKIFEVPFTFVVNGYNMNPYVEYGDAELGAPELLELGLSIERLSLLPDSQLEVIVNNAK